MSSPTQFPQNPNRVAAAVIGKSVTVKGQIYSKEDLAIDGEVDGSVLVEGHRLTIGPNGNVHANVTAHELVVLGSIEGNVQAAEKIHVNKQAKITGDIKTARIEAEDGAYLKGTIDTQSSARS